MKPSTGASVLAICLLVGLAASPAPAEPDDPSGRICVMDGLSRNVCIQRPIGRVISFSPSLTEMVFALNAGSVLAGRTARCNRPTETGPVPVIGAYMNPDTERVLSLDPQLVITTKTDARKEMIERLERLGIPVFVDDAGNADDVFRLIKKMGVLLSRETEARELVERLRKHREDLLAKVGRSDRPSVLLAVGTRPLVLAGGKSFIGALIREAGGDNIADDSSLPYPKFSMEEVIRKDPEIILVLDKECPDKNRCEAEWSRYPFLKAVKRGRVYGLDADIMARPGIGISDTLEKLASIFHPGWFDKAAKVPPAEPGHGGVK